MSADLFSIPETPFGQTPTLEVNGKVYAQSLAIATYVARETGKNDTIHHTF